MSKGQQHLYTSVLGAQIFDLFLFLSSCKGRAVITKGTATSDNECEAMEANKTSTKTPHTENVSTTASTVMSAVSYSKTLQGPINSTLSISTPVPEAGFNQTTPPSTASAKTLGRVPD